MQQLLLDHGGVVRRRDHPGLGSQLDWCVRTGELVSPLPGIHALPAVAATVPGRVRAAMLWNPDAVVVGRAAAALTFWPTISVGAVGLAQVDARHQRPGFALSRRTLDPRLIASDRSVRVSCPALTALDLCPELGGDPIDTVLRTRAASLAGLRQALELCPGRRGNTDRRRLLLESRDEPWSAAERLAHRILRQAGVSGWRANHPVVVRGRRYFLDIAFPGHRLVVEIDGREFHEGPEAFEADRHRHNALTAAGWRVLHITWRMLQDDPDAVVAVIRAELRH